MQGYIATNLTWWTLVIYSLVGHTRILKSIRIRAMGRLGSIHGFEEVRWVRLRGVWRNQTSHMSLSTIGQQTHSCLKNLIHSQELESLPYRTFSIRWLSLPHSTTQYALTFQPCLFVHKVVGCLMNVRKGVMQGRPFALTEGISIPPILLDPQFYRIQIQPLNQVTVCDFLYKFDRTLYG